MKIICKHCGNEFSSNWVAANYCSDKCRVAAFRERQALKKRQETSLKTCPACWCEFGSKNSKRVYCSDKCKQQAYRYWKKHDDEYFESQKRQSPKADPEQQAMRALRSAMNAALREQEWIESTKKSNHETPVPVIRG